MLKKVKSIDYSGSYTYSPPLVDSLINLDDVQSLIPVLNPGDYRVSGPLVVIKFRNGEKVVCQGNVDDFSE